MDIEAQRVDRYALPLPADQMHLDAAGLLVEKRAMRELRHIEVAAQLPIDSREQVEIERRRDAERIVVSRLQDFFGLAQVGSEQQDVAAGENAADTAQHRRSGRRIEIADGRSEEE